MNHTKQKKVRDTKVLAFDTYIIPRFCRFVSPFFEKNSDNLPYEKVSNNEPVCIADNTYFFAH